MKFPPRYPAAHYDACAGGLIAEVTVVVTLQSRAAGPAQRVLLAS
jgi:hypothetical protein